MECLARHPIMGYALAMKIHICKLCGATSDTSKFYAGVNQRCAECHKAGVKANRDEKIEYYRGYDAKRFQEDPRVRQRNERYRSTAHGIASVRAAQRKWDHLNKDKKAAHTILNNAVRDGRVFKPEKCTDCGSSGRIHGHHHDYAAPLDVEWLCQKCHWAKHKEEWRNK
jgi:predicted Zn-ribbon and HTH transcriptional regulator